MTRHIFILRNYRSISVGAIKEQKFGTQPYWAQITLKRTKIKNEFIRLTSVFCVARVGFNFFFQLKNKVMLLHYNEHWN